MTDHVEPEAGSPFSPDVDAVSVRPAERLRQDLAQALGIPPGEADDWIDEHGEPAAEERISAHWTDRGFYR